MGECYLYGQGGVGGNAKFATGVFEAAEPDSEFIQKVQLSTEFIPDYIVITCIGKGTATTNYLGYTMSIHYERKSNSWNIVHKRGASSDNGALVHYKSLTEWDSYGVTLTYNESTGEIVFKGTDGGYSHDYIFALTGASYRWIMWKE